MLKKILSHPLTRGLDPDDPQVTMLRRRIIKEKGFLYALYTEWYTSITHALQQCTASHGPVIELGAGGGFLKEVLPDCVTSEVFYCPHVDVIFAGQAMPFADASVRGCVCVDVFHHIPDVTAFLAEVERVLVPNGIFVMIEPWYTTFSHYIYTRLHPEPFIIDQGREKNAHEMPLRELCQKRWSFPLSGPLSGANGALPWIVFERDRELFTKAFPHLSVKELTLDYPVAYLLSGGVSMRSLVPAWCYNVVRSAEKTLSPRLRRKTAMFAKIILQKSLYAYAST